jgi:hypothetical protein
MLLAVTRFVREASRVPNLLVATLRFMEVAFCFLIVAFCENEWPAEEVEKVFSKFRTAIDIADHKTMASMIAPWRARRQCNLWII